jgi:hypothetical protein
MICHVCQKDHRVESGVSFSTGQGKFWVCNECYPSIDRVTELEQLLRLLRDRMFALGAALNEEPWMVRVANKAFQPTFPGLREAMGEIDTALWRKV